MAVNQLSVFLENRPGTLKKMCDVLAKHEIDMRALSLSEAEGFGIARIIVDDVIETASVLSDEDFVNSMVAVVAAEIPDTPGGLGGILKIFADADVNIEYMYAFLGRKQGSAYMIFKVADVKGAEAALRENGVKPVEQEDMKEL
ncbi:MAG: ACT domain-containing protein [Lachnospiraceae bacterium]|nr:ACT domain-containing protein [Lachnospiraceae bacterium]